MTHNGRAQVLVVDDEPDMLEVLELLLDGCGYRVVTARNGAEALAAMRRSRPAFVLLDLMMPVMDGWQFRAEQLRDPTLADVPVAIFTGSGATVRRTGLEGTVAFLQKPAPMEDVMRLVEAYAGPAVCNK